MPSATPTLDAALEAKHEDLATFADARDSQTEPLLSPNRHITTTEAGTVFYLAYGSNLSKETFRGVRKINPLSAKVVHVPSLSLVFDLPGVPYSEPCFANSKYRNPDEIPPKSPYHKDRWQKGLIGVVYEVTLDDYRKIIASEGGGVGYQDVMVDCYRLASGVASLEAGLKQDGQLLKAHTLLAPGKESGFGAQRPDPAYAQPSARYLKLITTGADEHSLPEDYKAYLNGIRPYTITTLRQRLGLRLFAGLWWLFLMVLFTFGRAMSNKKGQMPAWLGKLTRYTFLILWTTYDHGISAIFGDGERTIGQK